MPTSARRRILRAALLIAILVLYVVSIPWYRSGAGEVRLSLGLPDWVAMALGAYVAIAFLNAAAWMLTEIPEEDPAAGADR